MKSKRSARLGLAAAIWIVLSVAVFGTLIGVAWMSMNAKADVSVGSPVHDAVDDRITARDMAREIRSDAPHSTLLGIGVCEQQFYGYARVPF